MAGIQIATARAPTVRRHNYLGISKETPWSAPSSAWPAAVLRSWNLFGKTKSPFTKWSPFPWSRRPSQSGFTIQMAVSVLLYGILQYRSKLTPISYTCSAMEDGRISEGNIQISSVLTQSCLAGNLSHLPSALLSAGLRTRRGRTLCHTSA